MTDAIENLVLEHLKKIQAEQTAARERDREILARLANLEAGHGHLTSHIGHLASSIAQQQVALDRMSNRIEHIERRLELASG